MTTKKTERLFRGTDYFVKEVNLLIVMGAIPEEFVEFHPDKGIKIDYFITSFMEFFPKEELGDPWMAAFGNSIRYACQLIEYERAPTAGVQEFEHGEIGVAFLDTARLSRQLNMSKSKLDNLLHSVIEQNPEVQPFLMHDKVAGYVVSSFLLNRLQKAGLRLDKFLKKMVSGKISFGVN